MTTPNTTEPGRAGGAPGRAEAAISDAPELGASTPGGGMARPAPVWIPLDRVNPHPDHPRLVPREDVVSRIVAGMGDTYPTEHPIIVRPVGGGYQLIDGHLRVQAARRKELPAVWACVREMADDDAFLGLVTANAQAELSPLEIGLHARKYVEKSVGGRGRTGGRSEYARQTGLSQQYVTQLAHAAEVVEGKPTGQLVGFADKTQHLAAAHKTHPSAWPVLADLILERGWTVKQAREAADKVAEVFGRGFDPASSPWWGVFLSPADVARKLATDPDFTPTKVATLIAAADETSRMLAEFQVKDVNTAAEDAEWREWLADHAGGDSWNPRRHDRWREEMRNRLAALAPRADWLRGDWRDHVDSLPDGGVAALITDPPYGKGYVSNHRAARHAPIANDETPEVAAGELGELLAAISPKLRAQAHLFVFCDWGSVALFEAVLAANGFRVRAHVVWVKNNHGAGDLGSFAPRHELIIHATAGDAALYDREADVLYFDRVGTDRHPTEKPQTLVERLVGVSTVPGDLVIDPFGGVATTAAAAKALGRGYWSCELSDGYFAAGERRLGEGGA